MTTATSFLDWLRRSTRPTDDPSEEHRPDLLDQFYATLRVTYLAARPAGAGEAEVDHKLTNLFHAEPTWQRAYEIEQLLSLVMTTEQLDTELERRLEEAKTVKLPHVATLEKQSSAATTEDSKRTVLARMLNDLQWFYSQRIQRRAANKKLNIRVSSIFLSAFFFFFLVILIQFFALPKLLTDAENNQSNRSETQR